MTKAGKVAVNTTVKKEVLNRFRESCKELGCPMNIVLEAFMSQFADGEFKIKLGKNVLEVDIE